MIQDILNYRGLLREPFFIRASQNDLLSFFPVGLRILVVREDGLDGDSVGLFIDGEVSGIGKSLQQGEANIIIADGTGERIFFNRDKLVLQVKVKALAQAFAPTVIIIDSLLDFLKCFGGDLQFIASHQSSLNLFLAVSQSMSSSGCLV